MVAWARRVANGGGFQAAIIVVILVNAALVGLETSEALVAQHRALFELLDTVILAVFVAELAIRIVSYFPRPVAFFRDGWNLFDFAVVALSLLPGAGSYATVARVARLLRVVRLVSVFPELRLIVGTMLRSFASMGSVVVLLALVMYVYAVLGYHLFHEADPAHWGDLALSVRTLFEVLTLEGWLELQAAVLPAVPAAWLFFGTYVLLAVFIVVNLFIAVIPQQPGDGEVGARRGGAEGRRRRRAAAARQPAARRDRRRGNRPPGSRERRPRLRRQRRAM